MAVTGPRYKTPPTLDPNFKRDLDILVSAVRANLQQLSERLFSKALASSGLNIPSVSVAPLVKLIENVIIPVIHKFEGGWSDHPSDNGGATMRGVILTTFVSTFDFLFISTDIAQVKAAAQNLNNKYPNWKQDPSKSRQALYVVAGDEVVSTMWIRKFFTDKNCRYPIAVMTEDPFLGYFFAECCWTSGPGAFKSNGLDPILTEYGWNGEASTLASFCRGLGSRTPELAIKLLERRIKFILDISAPGKSNAVFRKGWMNRLVYDPSNSVVALLVKINETFNLNTSGIYSLTSNESAFLANKAAIYKTLNIVIP